MKLKSVFITMLLLLLPIGQVLGQQDGRYSFKYSGSFFYDGGGDVEFNASAHAQTKMEQVDRTGTPSW
jgi:hypothetical protein